jgi:molecular chaperone GrpE
MAKILRFKKGVKSKKKAMSKKQQSEDPLKNEGNETVVENQPAEQTPEQEAQDGKTTENTGGSDEKLKKLEGEVAEMKEKYLRLFAEFDNYKKRTIREKVDMMKTAAQDTLSALLPVLDDFDRAKKNAEDESSQEPFSEGVLLVYNKLYSTLKQKGLEPMETDGEAFNPDFHEAITEIPAPTEELKGKVVDTVEKGYQLNDRIIRHAKVVVGK